MRQSNRDHAIYESAYWNFVIPSNFSKLDALQNRERIGYGGCARIERAVAACSAEAGRAEEVSLTSQIVVAK